MLKPSVLLSEGIAIYLKDCLAREQSSRTVEGKRSSLRFFHVFCVSLGIRMLEEVTDDVLEAFRHHVRGYLTPYSGKPLDVATRRNKLTAIKVFCQRMFELHYFHENPASRFKLPKAPRRLPKGILVAKEVEAIFHQAMLHGEKGIRDRAILETYYATGIRRAELRKLMLDDVDIDTHLLRIDQAKGKIDRVCP